MSQNLPERSLRIFCLYVILTISYLRAQTIETSSLPTDSSRPLFKQIEIFSTLTVWLYISTESTFLNIRASYWSASSGFHLLCEIPAGATRQLLWTEIITSEHGCIFKHCSLKTTLVSHVLIKALFEIRSSPSEKQVLRTEKKGKQFP